MGAQLMPCLASVEVPQERHIDTHHWFLIAASKMRKCQTYRSFGLVWIVKGVSGKILLVIGIFYRFYARGSITPTAKAS
jgi:hypothetical protein